MYEIEVLTRSGPILILAKTQKQLYTAFKRFISPGSYVSNDEPDEIEIPEYPNANKLPIKIGQAQQRDKRED